MEIVGALKRRDAKKAAQFMEHHLQHIEAQIELSEDYVRVDFKTMLFGKPGVGIKVTLGRVDLTPLIVDSTLARDRQPVPTYPDFTR